MLPLGTFANAFLFEDIAGPWVLKLPAMIVFAREDRWRGSMNANVSEKVFDVSFVDACNTESQFPERCHHEEKRTHSEILAWGGTLL